MECARLDESSGVHRFFFEEVREERLFLPPLKFDGVTFFQLDTALAVQEGCIL